MTARTIRPHCLCFAFITTTQPRTTRPSTPLRACLRARVVRQAKDLEWDAAALKSQQRFLNRVWRLRSTVSDALAGSDGDSQADDALAWVMRTLPTSQDCKSLDFDVWLQSPDGRDFAPQVRVLFLLLDQRSTHKDTPRREHTEHGTGVQQHHAWRVCARAVARVHRSVSVRSASVGERASILLDV